MTKILLVEDDAALAELIDAYLHRHGFEVFTVGRGDHARESVRAVRPDLVILDVMLPGLDGLQVCRQLREDAPNLPIIMLTARGHSDDLILGLETGADDYVAKPCEPRVLLARIRTLLRRVQPVEAVQDDSKIVIGRLTIELRERQVFWRGREIEMSAGEYDLLVVLAMSPGQVLSRDDLIQRLRGIEFNGVDRSVDVAISKLRRKFEEDATDPRRIKTVWAKGYLFSLAEWEV